MDSTFKFYAFVIMPNQSCWGFDWGENRDHWAAEGITREDAITNLVSSINDHISPDSSGDTAYDEDDIIAMEDFYVTPDAVDPCEALCNAPSAGDGSWPELWLGVADYLSAKHFYKILFGDPVAMDYTFPNWESLIWSADIDDLKSAQRYLPENCGLKEFIEREEAREKEESC